MLSLHYPQEEVSHSGHLSQCSPSPPPLCSRPGCQCRLLGSFHEGCLQLCPSCGSQEYALLEPEFSPQFSSVLSLSLSTLESADYKRLSQKTLCLILLASGRRISEVANISRTSLELPSLSSLSLGWVPGFLPKTHSPSHQPSCPSIGYLSSDNGSSLPLCPVRAYRIYLARSSSWLADAPPHLHHHYLWSHQRNPRPASISYLSSKFRDLVADSRRFNDLDPGVDAGPHQMRKLSASYALQVGQNEDKVVRVMGFTTAKICR